MNRMFSWVAMAAFVLSSLTLSSRAAMLEFVVDPDLSSLTITPSVLAGGVLPLPSTLQGPNSFTAKYSGSIIANVTPTSIQFLPTTNLVAGNSGNWRPGTDYSNYPGDSGDPNGYINTAEPANYGVITDLSSIGLSSESPTATRDFVVSLADPAPKLLVTGAFDEAGSLTEIVDGTVYYSAGGGEPITDLTLPVIVHTPTAVTVDSGTLAKSGPVRTLTVPVSFTVSYWVNLLFLSTEYSGTIVATAVPEPSSAVLIVGSAALLVLRRQ